MKRVGPPITTSQLNTIKCYIINQWLALAKPLNELMTRDKAFFSCQTSIRYTAQPPGVTFIHYDLFTLNNRDGTPEHDGLRHGFT